MSSERRFDLICLGRAAVDLYGEQLGAPLEDMQSFAKYVGGCAANIAVGSARQGLRVAMVSRVGDEQMGRFVVQTLAKEGVDVSQVSSDPHRLTGLVLLGIRDRSTFPLIFYRENCADMALSAEHIDPTFIASAKALVVTGTHFSTPEVARASRTAMACAMQAGTQVVLDIDYRPVLWGLTAHCQGENRFIASNRVSEHLQTFVGDCDLIVGTEEEIHIAGGSTDTEVALRRLRCLTEATLVMKRGEKGCVTYAGPIDAGVEHQGFPVEVQNVLGAGDAFLGGFLRGFLAGEKLEACARYANAAGALVVSRHGCAPAMPTRQELNDYLERAPRVPRPELDERLEELHRVTGPRPKWPELLVFAMDHRAYFEDIAHEAGVDLDRLPKLKALLAAGARSVREGRAAKMGIIIDDRWGKDALGELTGSGWWLGRPIEQPGNGLLEFEGGPDVGSTLRRWPQEHTVKCLVRYHPGAAVALLDHQLERLHQLQHACRATEHELLLEVLPPADHDPDTLGAVRDLCSAGLRPEWWKVPPLPDAAAWESLAASVKQHDLGCRGILMLGAGSLAEELAVAFRHAGPNCQGFAVGRTIFEQPATAWLSGQLGDTQLIREIGRALSLLIELWEKRD